MQQIFDAAAIENLGAEELLNKVGAVQQQPFHDTIVAAVPVLVLSSEAGRMLMAIEKVLGIAVIQLLSVDYFGLIESVCLTEHLMQVTVSLSVRLAPSKPMQR